MKISIFVLAKKLSINKTFILKLIKKTVQNERRALNNLNLIIADDRYLRKLNKTFFKKDRPTNVIAFRMSEVSEIYVSQNRARNTEELYYFIIHGLLHLIGYNHRNKKEEELMEARCLKYLTATSKCQISKSK